MPDIFRGNPYLAPSIRWRSIGSMSTEPGAGISSSDAVGQPWHARTAPGAAMAARALSPEPEGRRRQLRQEGEPAERTASEDARRIAELRKSEDRVRDVASKIRMVMDLMSKTYTGPAGGWVNEDGNELIAQYLDRMAERASEVRSLAERHAGESRGHTGTGFADDVKALGPLFSEEEIRQLQDAAKGDSGSGQQQAPLATDDRGERTAFDGQEWRHLGPAPSLGRQLPDEVDPTRSLLFDAKRQPDRSARGATAARQAVNDMLDDPQLGSRSRSLLLEMHSKLGDALARVPEEQLARAKPAEVSRLPEPFDPNLGNRAVAAPTVQKLMMAAGGNPAAKQAMQAAYLADFRKAAASAVAEDAAANPRRIANGAARWLKAHRGGAANVLTPDQLHGLEAITRALEGQARAAIKGAGSDAARNLASKSILEAALWKGSGDTAWLAPVHKALNLFDGDADERILERVAEVMLDPKVAAALMKKATPGNVRMAEPVLAAIDRGAPTSAWRS